MGRSCLCIELTPVFQVPIVGLREHEGVAVFWLPTKDTPGFRNIEVEGLMRRLIMPVDEWGDFKEVDEGEDVADEECIRRLYLRSSTGVTDECFQILLHRSKDFCAQEKILIVARADGHEVARGCEVGSAQELVEIFASPDDVDAFAAPDPIKQNAEDAHAPRADDGAWADDGNIEIVLCAELLDDLLGFVLRPAVVPKRC